MKTGLLQHFLGLYRENIIRLQRNIIYDIIESTPVFPRHRENGEYLIYCRLDFKASFISSATIFLLDFSIRKFLPAGVYEGRTRLSS